ncbi:MAG TPA: type II toxin-antitoxin system ParD family antitoxin [Stellaceae bacterium]|nr:type II toxin-antitoxin system ParD family antitoxin [Stellaceae bacterium]
MPTRNISLTERFDRLVEAEIASGRYANASEVIRAGLSLLDRHEREQEMKLQRLRRAVQVAIEADERGESEPVSDIGAFLDEIEAEVDAEAMESAPGR